MKNRLHIAIPLLMELENLPQLIDDIQKQDFQQYEVYFCINQPDNWWSEPNNIEACENNQASIAYIKSNASFPFTIIDKSSPGKGWGPKKLGVGWARKILLDHITSIADENDIVISLDADTRFSASYFSSIKSRLSGNPSIPTIAVPYYHPLCGSEAEDRAILRYEIYMRYYLINLFRIKSPYAFSALGSAIAFPIWALKKIGGFTPKKSGEDFYFLQKMIKYKSIINWNSEPVYPAARFSNRVFFGTGPAMIKGSQGDWNSYPIYPHYLFDKIEDFYNKIESLYHKNTISTIDLTFGGTSSCFEIWDNLRGNNKDLKHFTKAVHDKFDGLRILQFLKLSNAANTISDESSLQLYLSEYHPESMSIIDFSDFSFKYSPLSQLNTIRDYLYRIENDNRRFDYEQYGT